MKINNKLNGQKIKPGKVLEIHVTDGMKLETRFIPQNGMDTIFLGISLASATRVIASSFADMLELPKNQAEDIAKQIAYFYSKDIFDYGSLGEEDSLKIKDLKEKEK